MKSRISLHNTLQRCISSFICHPRRFSTKALLISHSECAEHKIEGHVERPERLTFTLEKIRLWDEKLIQRGQGSEETAYGSRKRKLVWKEAPLAERDHLLYCHTPKHIDYVFQLLDQSRISKWPMQIDPDTSVCPNSRNAILRAAGSAIFAVEQVRQGPETKAFCCVRPPGHHAVPENSMGFCIFNNVFLGVHHALKLGYKRIALFDWDVHHGNGSEIMAWNHPNVLYLSTHQHPHYPGTGSRYDVGAYDNVKNAQLRWGASSKQFRDAVENEIIPKMEEFNPDFIFISAGFDAHELDPLSGTELTTEDFYWATRKMVDLADRFCEGRMVSILEGGYDLEGLAQSVIAHLKGLVGDDFNLFEIEEIVRHKLPAEIVDSSKQ